MNTKICTKCNINKPFDEFNWKNLSKGLKCPWCKQCFAEHHKSRYKTKEYNSYKNEKRKTITNRNRQLILDYLKDKQCVDCGEKRAPCLQFDHNDNVTKRNHICNMLTHSIKSIISEISKCTIRCANCHAIKTSKDQNWYATCKKSAQNANC